MTTTSRKPSWIGSWSAAASSVSMGRRCGPDTSALTTRRRARQRHLNWPEFPELLRQDFRNPHPPGPSNGFVTCDTTVDGTCTFLVERGRCLCAPKGCRAFDE